MEGLHLPKVRPPQNLDGGSQTTAINQFGDIVLVNEDYKLVYSALREGGQGKVRPITVDCSGSSKAFEEFEYNNVEFNEEGNMLLVYSTSSVGFINIPNKNAPGGNFDDNMMELNPCHFCELLSDTDFATSKDRGGVSVVKAAFHPLSSYHVVILLSNNTLMLTDALSDVSREFHLRSTTSSGLGGSGTVSPSKTSSSKNDNFISFCFGGDYDWMKMALLLLTADGQVYYLCPLLSSGALVPRSTIESLYAWVEEEVEGASETLSASAAVVAGRELRNYFRAVFESREVGDFEVTGESLGSQISASAVVSVEDEVLWGSYSPVLQGPLKMVAAGREVPAPVALTASKDSHCEACDLCTPSSGAVGGGGERAPIIAIAYSNGNVDLFTATSASAGPFIWPMWPALASTLATSHGGQGWDRSRLVPTLALVETVSIPHAVADTILPRVKLSPDPIHTHYLHLTNANNGAVYLLVCTWLKRTLQHVSEVADSSASLHSTSTQEALERIEREYLSIEDCEPSSVCRLLSADSCASGVDRHCGACVISDAMLGHLAIHRGSDGVIVATNITTCARLHQYRELVGARSTRSDASSSGAGGGPTLGSYGELGKGSYEKRANLLIETIQRGLQTVPMPTEDEDDEDTLSATKKKHLLAASRHLNEEVILPLEDLAHRTISALDSTRDIYDDQVRFLEGPNGFKSKLQTLNDTGKAALMRRVDSIGTRLLQQRARARILLTNFASQNATRATKQEKAYARQLSEWKAQLGVMQSMLTNLGSMVKVCTGEVLLHVDGNSASKSSFRARHGLGESPSTLSQSHASHSIRASLSHSPAKFNSSTATSQGTSLFQSPRHGTDAVDTTFDASQRGEDSGTGAGDGGGADSASKGRGLTPLQRRRRGGGGSTLGSSSAYRLANRMTSLNASSMSSTRGLASPDLSVLVPGSVKSEATQREVDTSSSVDASDFLAVNADRHLTVEELSYARDLLASQGRVLGSAEAQAESLQLLCTELSSQMEGLSKQTAA